MKQGAPLVVKGVAKGSAAHRSGQVFPGDEISFVKYEKKEFYDAFTSSFTKQRLVILTVLRDPKKGNKILLSSYTTYKLRGRKMKIYDRV